MTKQQIQHSILIALGVIFSIVAIISLVVAVVLLVANVSYLLPALLIFFTLASFVAMGGMFFWAYKIAPAKEPELSSGENDLDKEKKNEKKKGQELTEKQKKEKIEEQKKEEKLENKDIKKNTGKENESSKKELDASLKKIDAIKNKQVEDKSKQEEVENSLLEGDTDDVIEEILKFAGTHSEQDNKQIASKIEELQKKQEELQKNKPSYSKSSTQLINDNLDQNDEKSAEFLLFNKNSILLKVLKGDEKVNLIDFIDTCIKYHVNKSNIILNNFTKYADNLLKLIETCELKNVIEYYPKYKQIFPNPSTKEQKKICKALESRFGDIVSGILQGESDFSEGLFVTKVRKILENEKLFSNNKIKYDDFLGKLNFIENLKWQQGRTQTLLSFLSFDPEKLLQFEVIKLADFSQPKYIPIDEKNVWYRGCGDLTKSIKKLCAQIAEELMNPGFEITEKNKDFCTKLLNMFLKKVPEALDRTTINKLEEKCNKCDNNKKQEELKENQKKL